MKLPVILSIRGQQHYAQQEPEVIELVTEGMLEQTADGWNLVYEESDLTGLKGVTTTFSVTSDKIILDRKGPLCSQMIFQEGVFHESLYQMEFGALMISVTVLHMFFDITPEGGTVDLAYDIEIEHNAAGVIDYHLDIRAK